VKSVIEYLCLHLIGREIDAEIDKNLPVFVLSIPGDQGSAG